MQAREGLRAVDREPGRASTCRREAFAGVAGAVVERRQVPDEEAQDRRDRRHGAAGEGRGGAEGDRQRARRQGYAPRSTSSWPPAPARATFRQAGLEADGKRSGPIARRWPTDMPKSLLVIGSGAIGIEFASFYRTSVGRRGDGGRVLLDRILPVEDEEISAFAKKALREAGHEHPDRREGEEVLKATARRRDGDRRRRQAGDADRDGPSWLSALSAMSRTSGSKRWASSRSRPCRRRRVRQDERAGALCDRRCVAGRPGWRTRRATRA
jgi:hypothetical protein